MLSRIPWLALWKKSLAYALFVGVMYLMDTLTHGEPESIYLYLLIAFIILDLLPGWRRRRFPDRDQGSAPPESQPIPSVQQPAVDQHTELMPQRPSVGLPATGGSGLRTLGVFVIVLIAMVALGLSSIKRERGHFDSLDTVHLTVQVYSSQMEKAQTALDFLEQRLPALEAAFELVPSQRALVRIYDRSGFPGGGEQGHYHDDTICFSLESSPQIYLDRVDYGTVLVHEYVHFLVDQRCHPTDDREIPPWLNEGLAEWYSWSNRLVRTRAGDVVPLNSISDLPNEAKYDLSLAIVRCLAEEYGEQRTLSLIEAYAGQDVDPLGRVLGITEAELLDQVRASLTK